MPEFGILTIMSFHVMQKQCLLVIDRASKQINETLCFSCVDYVSTCLLHALRLLHNMISEVIVGICRRRRKLLSLRDTEVL
jgi:hypothetical protein